MPAEQTDRRCDRIMKMDAPSVNRRNAHYTEDNKKSLRRDLADGNSAPMAFGMALVGRGRIQVRGLAAGHLTLVRAVRLSETRDTVPPWQQESI
jgi:hypothetical protein